MHTKSENSKNFFEKSNIFHQFFEILKISEDFIHQRFQRIFLKK